MKTEQLTGYLMQIIPYGDYDGIARLFTQERGTVSVYLRSYRRSKKRFQGALDRYLFNEFSIQFKSTKDLHMLHGAKIIDPHMKLRSDPRKLMMAELVSEILTTLALELDQSYFPFYSDALKMIEAQEEPSKELLFFFKFALLGLTGFLPDPTCCATCGVPLFERGYLFFDREKFHFNCLKHKGEETIKLTDRQIAFLSQAQKGIFSSIPLTQFEQNRFQSLFEMIYRSINDRPLLSEALLKEFL